MGKVEKLFKPEDKKNESQDQSQNRAAGAEASATGARDSFDD